MLLQVGVKIFLKNHEGKFLLLERNLEKYPEISKTEKWDIVGGRINPETPLMANLEREIFEETKLVLKSEPRLICAQDIMKPDKHVVRLTYLGQTEGDPQIDEEHKNFKWFSMDELLAMPDMDKFAKEALGKLQMEFSAQL